MESSMRRLLGLVFAVVLIFGVGSGCRKTYEANRPYTVYPQSIDFFKPILNESETSDHLVTIKEDNYPIQLRLYQDGRFWYRLRKLGDGWGTWSHKEEGYLDLYAERTIFVMQMQIHSIDPNNKDALSLEFSDRFGPKFLHMSQLK